MPSRGVIFDSEGNPKCSWRSLALDEAPMELPVANGDQIVYLPEDADDAVALAVHRSLHEWTMAEMIEVLGGEVMPPLAVATPRPGRYLWLRTSHRVVVENDRDSRPRPPRDLLARGPASVKADLLARRRALAPDAPLALTIEPVEVVEPLDVHATVVAILPGGPLDGLGGGRP